MRAPYEYFVRFLITQGKEFQEANNELQVYGFLSVKEDYFAWIRSKVHLPLDFQPLIEDHTPSAQALKQIGVKELWLQDSLPHVQRAFEILTKPLIRKMADILSLSPVTHAEMCQAIKERYGYLISDRTMECFILFFANYTLLSPVELRGYVAKTREYWKLAVMRGDADLTKFQLGMDVTVDSRIMVEGLTHLGYFGAMSTRDMPQNLDTARMAGEYSKLVEWGIEQREKVRDTSGELTKALRIDYVVEEPKVLEPEPEEKKQLPSAREINRADNPA